LIYIKFWRKSCKWWEYFYMFLVGGKPEIFLQLSLKDACCLAKCRNPWPLRNLQVGWGICHAIRNPKSGKSCRLFRDWGGARQVREISKESLVTDELKDDIVAEKEFNISTFGIPQFPSKTLPTWLVRPIPQTSSLKSTTLFSWFTSYVV
jgi:hypothetical protein